MSQKILLVDSDSVSRHRSIAALLPAGYQLCVAEDPLDVATVVALESPDLVLLADSMTHQSGLETVGRLFSTPSTAVLPVLIIANTAEGLAAAERSGARAVMAGPLAPADLLDFVAPHVGALAALPQAPSALLNDSDRLDAVAAIRADLDGENNLDQFTQLASKLLNVPVSTVTLIEKDKQIYASQVGVGEPWASAGGSPLQYSYCQFAMTSRAPLRIDDATTHPLVMGSPAVSELNAISYLGIPLITSDDLAVGTLCAIDSRPRHWTDSEVSLLGDLAEVLTTQLSASAQGSGRHSPR